MWNISPFPTRFLILQDALQVCLEIVLRPLLREVDFWALLNPPPFSLLVKTPLKESLSVLLRPTTFRCSRTALFTPSVFTIPSYSPFCV